MFCARLNHSLLGRSEVIFPRVPRVKTKLSSPALLTGSRTISIAPSFARLIEILHLYTVSFFYLVVASQDVQQFWVRVSACLDGNRHNFSSDAASALNSLSAPKTGRIDLIGCGLLDPKGEELLDELKTLTFADVVASLDDLSESTHELHKQDDIPRKSEEGCVLNRGYSNGLCTVGPVLIELTLRKMLVVFLGQVL
jgi:hypothetical protein